MSDDKCVRQLVCLAPAHKPDCPQNPANIQVMRVSAAEWDRVMEELAGPPREVPELRALIQEHRDSPLIRWDDE